MKDFTKGQRAVLVIAALLAVAMLVVVPMGYNSTYGRMTGDAYALYGSEPTMAINTTRLLMQFAVLGFLTWVGLNFAGRK